MQKRTLKVALLAVLTIVLVLGLSTAAFADQTWSDLPDSVTAKYGVDDNQVAAISDGYAGGLWKPYQSINRAQFTKMAVAAFDIPLVDAATASFTDVPKGSYYYPYVEGAKAAGIVNGTTATTFGASTLITRQQALAIIARYVADAAGYDLATMYSTDEIAALVAHFGDAASISADLKDEMAFAFDFGITVGNDYGNLDPLANLTRIQGAVMLIRAQAKVPPATWTAANIELVSEDETENLIGQVHSATFEVTTADGHPAKNVLVDFDTLYGSDFNVGNISQQAALTNNYGQVTINLLSTEPGTQRVAATVAGVGTIYTTKYWVAMDEVYITDSTREFENNAGDSQTLSARVVVFGPGPLSTSAQDWYNAIDADTTGALAAVDWPIGFAVAELVNLYRNVLPVPGSITDWDDSEIVEWAEDWWDTHEDLIDDYPGEVWDLLNLIISTDRWSYDVELFAAVHGYAPRGMAGISTDWSIVNVVNDNPATTTVDETVPSVGDIIAADEVTDADGLTSCTIKSTEKGDTIVQVLADYAENPYPGQLFNHLTSQIGLHFLDWDDQPLAQATAILTWIPHVLPDDGDVPIEATYDVSNVGEAENFVLTLADVYGNLIDGYTVMWWIQGVGELKTDDSSWSGIGEQNKDWDVTVNGKADVWVKSSDPGQTIVHCKVMDKYGLPYKEWNVTKQWYRIDNVTLGEFDTDGDFIGTGSATNVVNTGHTWIASVIGAKYVHVLYDVNGNTLSDDQALLTSRAELTGIANLRVAKMVNNALVWQLNDGAAIQAGMVYSLSETGAAPRYTAYAHLELGDAEFMIDMNDDGVSEVWSGLAGKTVYFYNNIGNGSTPTSNTPLTTIITPGAYPTYVGSITSATPVVTDDLGFASVTINSTNKGYQYIYAVADYVDNSQVGDPLVPLNWAQLKWDSATKLWTTAADATPTIKVFAAGDPNVEGVQWTNPVDPTWNGYGTTPDDSTNPNVHRIAVGVFDQYGNALPGYKVTFEVMFQGTNDEGTYFPYAHFRDVEAATGVEETPAHDNPLAAGGDADVADRGPVDANPVWNSTENGDADYAWGWTLNSQINFTLTDASAAYADLVLDQSAEALSRLTQYDDFANIVNIFVYAPGATSPMAHYEVTKIWSLDDPELTSIVLEGALNNETGLETGEDDFSAGPWTFDISDGQTSVDIRAYGVDQFGNQMVLSATDYNWKAAVVSNYLPFNVIYNESNMTFGTPYTWAEITGINVPNTATIQVWNDKDGDNIIDATELSSNILTATWAN